MKKTASMPCRRCVGRGGDRDRRGSGVGLECEEEGEREDHDQGTNAGSLRSAQGVGLALDEGRFGDGEEVSGVRSHGLLQKIELVLQHLVLVHELLVETRQLIALVQEMRHLVLELLNVDLLAHPALLGGFSVLDEAALALQQVLLGVRQGVEGFQAALVLLETAAGQGQELLLGQLRRALGEDRGMGHGIGVKIGFL